MVGRIISGFVSVKLPDNMLIKAGMVFVGVGILILMLPISRMSL